MGLAQPIRGPRASGSLHGESFPAKRRQRRKKRAGKKEAARLAGRKGLGIALPRREPANGGMSELSRLRGSEGYGAREDEDPPEA